MSLSCTMCANHVRDSLSGPLNRLNAILSLLRPLDRYSTPSAIGSAIGRPYLALSRIHAQAGVLNRLFLNRLGGSTARWWHYSVENLFKTSAKRKRERGCNSQPRPRPRLNSQPQRASKAIRANSEQICANLFASHAQVTRVTLEPAKLSFYRANTFM